MNEIHLTAIGHHFNRDSGTRLLMDDLGRVRQSPEQYVNLGGGNPGRVPAIHAWFSEELARLASQRTFDSLFSAYEDPLGSPEFRTIFAEFLTRNLGWPVTAGQILCTTGSQASFFMLFNVLAGADSSGGRRRILLPQSPEYIGYSELCLDDAGLTAVPSALEITGQHRFRYTIDFESLRVTEDIAAICISRPTNPTGNICTDLEIRKLSELAGRHRIPLIVDCAYGEPFPGITFQSSSVEWNENLVMCFSLSKLGLPGLRVGIVLAPVELIQVLSNMQAAMVLTSNPLGARLAQQLFQSDSVLEMVNGEIRPFYADKLQHALDCCEQFFDGLDYFVHEPGGAIFLWIWFRGLPISAAELYERLKRRGVLVIPGHLFAPGLPSPSRQMTECIRVSYAQSAENVEKGLRIIADEVRRCGGTGR